MREKEIQSIFDQFEHKFNFQSYSELISGHINDTFLILTDANEHYVLQCINHNVFKNVPGLISNKVTVSNHLLNKLNYLSPKEIGKKVLCFIKAKSSENFYYTDGINYWNLMPYIEEGKTHEVVTNSEIAYEGGKLMGEFLNLTSDLDNSKLVEVIPKFHDMSFRFQQYKLALQSARVDRLKKAELYINWVSKLRDEMQILQNLKEIGKIRIRVTHNDTKISNMLFDEKNIGMCVLDTDTVMPGIVHYDFGDAIRTICNTATEDEIDLSKVEFNLEFYKSYVRGFLEKTGETLTPIEIEYLPLAAKTMIFIIGLRFLTDYLNNDVYFKTKYSEHNLDRTKNQFKLIYSLEQKYNEMEINL
ncbi:aminoglycoside phosphotransferase family protein [Chryseobacterium sp. RP-3-3]|uniref:Aminoglycoside phosphotransferase family protein n=1 Tax=Chryseobacterium antibioticum TaxID=2728847 RepID=A0A7Y0FQV1_9FLAO|nr:aminoglycoside phosphotransferase family protein [Chryseobacterium antibioticum]NML69075.1 aminoglycoside phosphotransferase family protein [Chryseobacterium antibioticum]